MIYQYTMWKCDKCKYESDEPIRVIIVCDVCKNEICEECKFDDNESGQIYHTDCYIKPKKKRRKISKIAKDMDKISKRKSTKKQLKELDRVLTKQELLDEMTKFKQKIIDYLNK